MSMQDRLFGMLDQGHDNLLLRFGLGKALTEDGQADQAITHLLKAVEFDETHASSWFWLGRAYLDEDRKSTRLNSSHVAISYAVFSLKKKTNNIDRQTL